MRKDLRRLLHQFDEQADDRHIAEREYDRADERDRRPVAMACATRSQKNDCVQNAVIASALPVSWIRITSAAKGAKVSIVIEVGAVGALTPQRHRTAAPGRRSFAEPAARWS